jgi:hypothetical protein
MDLWQQREFEMRGVVRVDAAVDPLPLVSARDAVIARLEKAGLWRDGGWHAQAGPSTAKVLKRALHGCTESRPFRDLAGEPLLRYVCTLVGSQPMAMPPGSQLLFTPPNAQQWSVPHSVWHVDLPRLGEQAAPGVQAFMFLDTVVHGGGGTLLVAGSHRLLNDAGRLGSKELKRRLARIGYFRDLMDRRLPQRELFAGRVDRVGEVALQVVELTGAPGDVWFVDMRTLHSLGPNTRPEPRMMVTRRWLTKGVAERLDDVFGERLAVGTQ